MSHRVPPKPPHFDTAPLGTCRWCNEEIGLTRKGQASKARWHLACVKAYKLLFWPSATRRAVWARDQGKCQTCGTICQKRNNGWHLDHIKPLIESNGDLSFWQMGNLQTLCKPCHTAKTSQEATERALARREAKKLL